MNSSAIFNDDEPIGAGLFSNLSLLNHSCCPNINIKHQGNVVQVKANKNIEVGEEIFNSYIDTTLPKNERKKILLSQFEFECKCSLCYT